MPVVAGMVYGPDGMPAASRKVRVYRRDTGVMLGEMLTGDGTPVPVDDGFSSVSLLLHMDGGSGSAPIDSSQYGHVASLVSPAALSASAAKFGLGSYTSNGGGALTFPSHSSFALPGDFTIEAWVMVSAFSPALASILNIGSYSSGVLLRISSNQLEFFINGTSYTGPATVATGVWHHIAVTRSGSACRLFLNGAQVGAFTNSVSIAAAGVMIGRSAHNGGEYVNGFIDEVRISKGLARYTGSFALPSAAFPNGAVGGVSKVGYYSLAITYLGEVQRIVLDDDAGDLHNDLIDRVMST